MAQFQIEFEIDVSRIIAILSPYLYKSVFTRICYICLSRNLELWMELYNVS